MRTLDYNYSTASGYVQPYPLLNNLELNYPVLLYASPVTSDFHAALMAATASFVTPNNTTSITLPTTGGGYVYVTAPTFINVQVVYFNGFPIQLVPVEQNVIYTLAGTTVPFNTYRFLDPQHGTNFTITVGN